MEHASVSSTDVGSTVSSDVQHQKRTSYRWAVLFMIAMMALITFMDRTNISIAAPRMSKEFGLSKIQMGFVFSVFAWAYAAAQIPAGWLSDKFGPRKVLTLVVLFWSVMTMATAHAWGFVSLLVIRFIFGLGEAASWPAGTQAMQFWYPKSERGLANGVTHSCGQFAASLVPLVAVALMTRWGWRSIFHIFGTVGILWSIGFWFIYRNRPDATQESQRCRGCLYSRRVACSKAKAGYSVEADPWMSYHMDFGNCLERLYLQSVLLLVLAADLLVGVPAFLAEEHGLSRSFAAVCRIGGRRSWGNHHRLCLEKNRKSKMVPPRRRHYCDDRRRHCDRPCGFAVEACCR